MGQKNFQVHHRVSIANAIPWTACKRKKSKSWNFFHILWQKSFGPKFISIVAPNCFACNNAVVSVPWNIWLFHNYCNSLSVNSRRLVKKVLLAIKRPLKFRGWRFRLILILVESVLFIFKNSHIHDLNCYPAGNLLKANDEKQKRQRIILFEI